MSELQYRADSRRRALSQTETKNRKGAFATHLSMHSAKQPAWQGASRFRIFFFFSSESREKLELLAEPDRHVGRVASRCADEVGRQKRVYGPWIGAGVAAKNCPGTCARTPVKITCPPGDPSGGRG